MIPKAIVTIQISQSQLNRLRTRFTVIESGWGRTGYRLNESDLIYAISGAQVLLVGYEKVSRSVVEHTPSLKLIGCSRANPVNVDIDAATDHHIPVIHTPGRNAIAAAEFTIGLMLSISRHIALGNYALKTGRYLGKPVPDFKSTNRDCDVTWDLDGSTPYLELRGVELHNHTLGLIGLGNVASKVAQLAKAFGMRVISTSPPRDAERAEQLGIQLVELDTLLKTSDFISIHCKVTPETCGMIDQRAFSLMKSTAYLINTARAMIIDQEALIQALENKMIGGAALDVFWYEPLPANHPLLRLENVVLTPHLGGSTFEVPERHSQMLVDDVFAWMDGQPIHNLVNPGVFDDKKRVSK
jgi:D-3-phosphoglycerate dehydrogenase / 2-oxoglutarate reductase